MARKNPLYGKVAAAVRSTVAAIPVGQDFGRKELAHVMGDLNLQGCLQTLLKYKYVERVRPGVFRRIQEIPLDGPYFFCDKSTR